MGDLEPTEYPKPLEPTEYVKIYNPYEITSPYDKIPPPPPSPKAGISLKSVLIGLAVVLVIALPITVGIIISSSSQGGTNIQGTSTPYPNISNGYADTATAMTSTAETGNATAIAADTATATSIIQPKTALDILADMQNAGLQPYQVHANIPECFSKSPSGLQSTVCFRNVALCNLGCDEDMVWIEVFDNQADAQAEYQSWVQSSGPVPQVIVSGHCVLAGNSMSGTYAQILAQDCQ